MRKSFLFLAPILLLGLADCQSRPPITPAAANAIETGEYPSANTPDVHGCAPEDATCNRLYHAP